MKGQIFFNDLFFNRSQVALLFKRIGVIMGMAAIGLVLQASNVQAQIQPDNHKILYVDATATGNGSGSDWANAIPGLATALHYARLHANNWTNDSLRIYVAEGTYFPEYRADNNTLAIGNQNNAFVLVKNVQLYGGFPSGGGQRNWLAHPTILSGNIGTAAKSDNAYHVVISAGDVGRALVDGFTVTDGNASGIGSAIMVNTKSVNSSNGGGVYNNSSSPKFKRVNITRNTATWGAGVYNYMHSSPMLQNVSITSNVADHYGTSGYGGGIYNYLYSSPTLTNVLIADNSATTNGGGLYNGVYCMSTLTNVTIANNIVGTAGSAMYNYVATLTINNSIIFGGITSVSSPRTTYQYSFIKGNNQWNTQWGTDGGHNIISNNAPFIDSAQGNYHLKPTSPTVDGGNNSLFPGNINNAKDLMGKARLFGGTIDMGPFESLSTTPLPVTLTQFTAQVNPNQKHTALIHWETAQEANSAYFEILRSKDGKNWQPIGRVKAAGNSTAMTNYQWIDYQPLKISYYRLKQVDIDGSATFSEIRQVQFAILSQKDIMIYPNPSHGQFTIKAKAGQRYSIFDVRGSIINRGRLTNGSAEVNIKQEPIGLYFLRVGNKVIKVVKQ